jgi:hypothetical protein|tara:strand:+ start:445 stop:822 length:378 start_codon:yes stop_codon:yes gene_type:complete
MAEPNIVNVTSIVGRSKLEVLKDDAITDSNASILTCAANKLIKINSIICANIDGSNNATVDVAINHHDHGRHYLAYTVTVPADSTLIVIGKDSPIYLEEGDELEARASADNDIDICVSYEQLDDA